MSFRNTCFHLADEQTEAPENKYNLLGSWAINRRARIQYCVFLALMILFGSAKPYPGCSSPLLLGSPLEGQLPPPPLSEADNKE